MGEIEVANWFGSIRSHPAVIVEAETVEEIVAVLNDRERCPSPVRAVGSNHSTTLCGVADGGTLIVMRKMDSIVEIRDDSVTALDLAAEDGDLMSEGYQLEIALGFSLRV